MKEKPPTKNLHILMVCSSYPRFKGDSAAIFLHLLAKALNDKNITVSVLAPDEPNTDAIATLDGINVYHFRYFIKPYQKLAYGAGILPNISKNPWLMLQIPLFACSMFFSIHRLCRRLDIGLIHAHWIIPQGFVAMLAGKLLKIPVVTTAHGGDAFAFKNKLFSALKSVTLYGCDAWTSNTVTTANAIDPLGRYKSIHIVPMGVDVTMFCRKAEIVTLPKQCDGKMIVLFVGRLVEKKGVRYLIEAFAQLDRHILDGAVLLIIGDGHEKNSLVRLSTKLGLEKNIFFIGKIQNDQLLNYYSQAHLFVAPSIIDKHGDTEGQGIVLLEAMACRVPIIASRVGGIVDVISDNTTGMLVDPGDASSLCECMQKLLENPELSKKLTDNAEKFVNNQYSWPIISQQFKDIFQSLI